MNWDDLQYLLALSRRGTMTGAGELLGVNHTTVARRVRLLEERLETRLVERQPEGYALTQAGESLQRVAERVEDEIMSFDRSLLGQDARLSGSLRVSVVDSTLIGHKEVFCSFVRLYPDIDLQIDLTTSIADLSRREADVVLRATNTPAEHLVGTRVARVEYALYVARGLFEERGKSLDPNDYPWVMWALSAGATMIEGWMKSHAPRARVACRLNSAMAIWEMIRGEAGIGFLPCSSGDRSPDLMRMRPVEPGFGVELWLLTHPDMRRTARIRAFMEHMRDYFRLHKDLFEGKLPL